MGLLWHQLCSQIHKHCMKTLFSACLWLHSLACKKINVKYDGKCNHKLTMHFHVFLVDENLSGALVILQEEEDVGQDHSAKYANMLNMISNNYMQRQCTINFVVKRWVTLVTWCVTCDTCWVSPLFIWCSCAGGAM